LLQELKLTLRYCLETHIHADHITGAGELRKATQCLNLVPWGAAAPCADHYIKDGEILQLGLKWIEAIATPGHTDSHLAYRINGDRVLTGDALLIRGCGRTDFQSGDAGMLYDSVTQRLFVLPDETRVYPGHDYRGYTVSTIGEEKQWNLRFVQRNSTFTSALRSRDDFIQVMKSLKLADPKKMLEAIPANQNCGYAQEKQSRPSTASCPSLVKPLSGI
jgi:glyoxylase-like metal-dependent hydrolase (beta-lactamase superfamily II)